MVLLAITGSLGWLGGVAELGLVTATAGLLAILLVIGIIVTLILYRERHRRPPPGAFFGKRAGLRRSDLQSVPALSGVRGLRPLVGDRDYLRGTLTIDPAAITWTAARAKGAVAIPHGSARSVRVLPRRGLGDGVDLEVALHNGDVINIWTSDPVGVTAAHAAAGVAGC
jgi:hypothetical protein